MAKKQKNTTAPSNGRPLGLEDLEQIVGGATTAQYDATKQALLGEMNNADISNAVAADAAAIASSPSHIATAITDIESHAATDHVSEAAALAALDAATYGNAKVGGVDAVATALTTVLTSGTGEADMAHLAALGANPTTLVTELGQAVNVLAMGSTNGHTALGLSTTAATDWVEAKLEVAAGSEATTDNLAAASQLLQAATSTSLVNMVSHAAAAQTDQGEAQAATALQTLLDTSHQGEVAEGKAIDAVMTALGANASHVAADAALLAGLTGAAAVTAGQAEVTAVEGLAGVQKDVALVALDLMAQGNAAVQQAMATELGNGTTGPILSNLAGAVAIGGITADQAVETLNLTVTDLAQNSVNAGTIPALEQGFAIAQADVALANAAASTAAGFNLEAGYATGAAAATDHQDAALATSLQTLINTNYAGEVSLANELNSIIGELGSSAAGYEQQGASLISNPSLAASYISQIEAAATAAEAAATPGSPHGAFSVDAALTLLAVYSHGNPTVLAEINARLVNGSAEADLATLTALGTLTASQAVTTLTGMVDALAAVSPNNAVTLTGSDGHSITIDRGSAVDWAEGQLAKAAVSTQSTLQSAVLQDVANALAAIASLNGGRLAAAEAAATAAAAEDGGVTTLVNLLEGSLANQVITGLGIDTAWTAAAANADAAAVIAAGTSLVQTSYGLESQVSAAATAQANTIEAGADQREMANFNLAQQIMQLNLGQVWTANDAAGDTAAAAAVNTSAMVMASEYITSASDVIGAEFDVPALTTAINDPNLQNFANLAIDTGVQIFGPKFEFSALDLGLQGMAAILQSSAVSDVIGSRAAGDLATYYTALHDAVGGALTLFNDDMLLQGAAAIQLGEDAVQVAENTYTFSNDLVHGNFSSLGGDAQTLFTNLGTATLTFAEDYAGDLLLGIPLPEAGAMLNDVVSAFGTLGSDIMSNKDFASAVNAVQAEGQTVLNDIEGDIGSSTDAAISNAFKSAVSWLSNSEQTADNIWSSLTSSGFWSGVGSDLDPANWF